MKRLFVCILSVLLICPAGAKQLPAPSLTTEQQQQFTYYWYAAKQAIVEERYPDALVLLEFCEKLNPKDGVTLDALGVVYSALQQEDRAIEMWRRAFEASPRDRWYRYSAALLDKKTDNARKEALRVMETAYKAQLPGPVDEDLLEQLSRLYMSEERWKEVIRTQDELDRLKGYDVYSAYRRTSAYALWGKNKKALAEIDKYLELDPTNVQFHLYRIDIMAQNGANIKDIYARYEKVLAIDPYNLSVLNNYAYLLATHGGNLNKAERMSLMTIQREPDNPVYLDTYGWILYLQGQDQLALFYLKKALNNAGMETQKEIRQHIQTITKEKK